MPRQRQLKPLPEDRAANHVVNEETEPERFGSKLFSRLTAHVNGWLLRKIGR